MVSNSASGTFHAALVQAGTVHGGVHVHGQGLVRSHYRHLVEQRFAPAELVGRARELAELADFCTAADVSSRYMWWRAEMWAGKTALLATFVLDPPAGVRVVSFFVTATRAGHSDRQAFVEVVLEQLWELIEQPAPPDMGSANREGHLLGLWEQAERVCRQRGERLVLVVDGLDEDRGWDASPEARSIAAMLPNSIPGSMRVIVSGRHHPPVPNDVPDEHPLKSPQIVRSLVPSPAASAVRKDMERDLKRLLGGSPLQRDLLGLLTAAGGELSILDLAELAEVSPWQIEDRLHSADGRNFEAAGPHHDHSNRTVVLAHYGLQTLARSMLEPQLSSYRDRLHAWAQGYAEQRWPASSPDWLFAGYFRMLLESGDLDRILACATDSRRHRAWRFRTGADSAALTEISTAQTVVRHHRPEPDLVALARLAVHRVHLRRAVHRIPPTLPAGWARLGQVDRAEAMLDAITDPIDRIDATLNVARVCHNDEDWHRALALLEQADAYARVFDQSVSARPVASVAPYWARVGQHERAHGLVACIADPREKTQALAAMARQAASTGDHDRAAVLLAQAEETFSEGGGTLPGPALSAIAVAAWQVGQRDRAHQALAAAERTLLREDALFVDVQADSIARDAALIDDTDAALRVVAMISKIGSRESLMHQIVEIIAARDGEKAEEMARAIDDPASLCQRLAAVAEHTRDRERADRLIAEADSLVAECSPSARPRAQIAVAQAAAVAGDLDRALELARAYAEHGTDADAVLGIAQAAVAADAFEQGADMIALAEYVARAATAPDDERRLLLWIRAMGDADDLDRAERWAASFHDDQARSAAWALIAEAALAAGQLKRADQALTEVADPALQRRARLDVIRGLVIHGQSTRAVTLARGAADPAHRVRAILVIAEHGPDSNLLDEAADSAELVDDPDERMRALLAIIETSARLYLRDRTSRLLARLRTWAEEIAESEQGRQDPMRTRDILRVCRLPMRTLTEIAEAAALLKHKPASLFQAHQDLLLTLVPADRSRFDTTAPPRNADLAVRLCRQDWCYAVDELLTRFPEAYSAITAELDALTQ
ncbi:hypothetical protein [Saccharopolyspora sp. SCSIO 74807]|uniref:hypothetical protein n=1 Tax=Saccharopolyspora sp. SCSIO 74807 TaxID=3118084 RepID=UPI0030D083D5